MSVYCKIPEQHFYLYTHTHISLPLTNTYCQLCEHLLLCTLKVISIVFRSLQFMHFSWPNMSPKSKARGFDFNVDAVTIHFYNIHFMLNSAKERYREMTTLSQERIGLFWCIHTYDISMYQNSVEYADVKACASM